MSPRTAACALLPLLAGCLNVLLPSRQGSDGTDDPEREGSPDREEAPDCGIHAQADGGQCECVDRYDWCDDSETDCCAWDAAAYRVTIVSAFVMPYKDDGELWDWDGDIPDWLIEALELLGYAVPEAATAADVLDLIDEYAPELMDDYVPPDAFWELYDGDDVLDAGATLDDTYEPAWGDTVRLAPGSRAEYTLYFYDEDVAFDDDVQGLILTLDDLAWASGQGELTVQHLGNLFELTVEIEPVW